MHRKAFVIILSLLLISPLLWSQTLDWEYAKASASGDISEARSAVFKPAKPDDLPAEYHHEGEGWIWLRARIPKPSDSDSIVFEGPQLAWSAWWNNEKIGESGTPPVFWSPSSAMPVRIDTSGPEGAGVLLVKTYVRRGYTDFPGFSWSTGSHPTADTAYIIAIIRYISSFAAVFFGLLLFIGGLFAFVSRRLPWDGAMALFGMFSILAFAEPVLALFPDIGRLFSWSVISVTVRAAAPFLLSSWRRSISSAGRKDPTVLSIIDIILAATVALWLCLPFLPREVISKIISGDSGSFLRSISSFAFVTNPLPGYALWSFTLAVVLWISRSVGRRSGRFGSLIILLVSLFPVLFEAMAGSTFVGLADVFIKSGIVASLIISLPVIMSRRLPGGEVEPAIGKQALPDPDSAEDEAELEELEELGEIEEISPIPSPVPVKTATATLKTIETGTTEPKRDSSLVRSLRSSMFPESMPWDPDWDLASARQGRSHPATGFHDVYTDSAGKLSGFAFMDTGTDSLEALFYSHLVQSELSRLFTGKSSLPRIARSIHRKSAAAAATAGKPMKGVFGRFSHKGLTFLPMANPPIILRKSDGRLILLSKSNPDRMNMPLGVEGFGSDGLKTMSVSMETDDVAIIYTPMITRSESPGGEEWGLKGLSTALKLSEAKKPEGIVAEIIGELKNFIGRDVLEEPLQLLAIKKR